MRKLSKGGKATESSVLPDLGVQFHLIPNPKPFLFFATNCSLFFGETPLHPELMAHTLQHFSEFSMLKVYLGTQACPISFVPQPHPWKCYLRPGHLETHSWSRTLSWLNPLGWFSIGHDHKVHQRHPENKHSDHSCVRLRKTTSLHLWGQISCLSVCDHHQPVHTVLGKCLWINGLTYCLY